MKKYNGTQTKAYPGRLSQPEYYDSLARLGGWIDFDQMVRNIDEIQAFAFVLFDALCDENGYKPPFTQD